MEREDELKMYAMAALIGLVMRGVSPNMAAQEMWNYANLAINFKELKND
jgi:hypothetical protein